MNETPASRVLLLGSSGRLGGAIRRALEPSGGAITLVAPSRGALDGPASVRESAERWFTTWRPDVVVNCIAMSDVDRCEHEPRAARETNADLPEALAGSARRHGAHLVHFSTDFVFDGALRRPYREDDRPNPLSVYGSTKLDGESAIAAQGAGHWIFRVSWLYGSAERNLAAKLLDPANAGRSIALADDRVGVPNPVQLLAREVAVAIARLRASRADAPASGVYHLSCHGHTTWYSFGREFVSRAVAASRLPAAQAPRIEAFSEKAADRPARRPAWSALDPGRYETTFGRTMPHWRDAIEFALQ